MEKKHPIFTGKKLRYGKEENTLLAYHTFSGQYTVSIVFVREERFMKQSLGKRKIAGFLFVSVSGTFLHFFYDLTGKRVAAALVSAVNESIWEHMKLIFYPMLLFSAVEQRYVPDIPDEKEVIRGSSLAGILLALLLIPVLYYTYTGVLGVSADWFNITIFFLAAGAAYYLSYRMEKGNAIRGIGPGLWWFVMVLIAGTFTVATFYPPGIPLFRDPLDGHYGIR